MLELLQKAEPWFRPVFEIALKVMSFFLSLFFSISTFLGLAPPAAQPVIPPEEVLPATHPIHARNPMPSTFAATDALGRALPEYAEVGGLREDRFVGVFYFTWHVAHANTVAQQSPGKPVNVNNIIEANPEAIHDLNFPEWGPIHMPHHWNEPLFGYYDSDDRWVLRKHAEMLANAGVDVVIFDCTNSPHTFKESYDVVFEVFHEAREQGVNTPKIAFLFPFAPGELTNVPLREVYTDIYQQGRYQDLWFYWKGKPLVMAYPELLGRWDPLDQEILRFFNFRPCNPLYASKGSGTWNWLSVYPQPVCKNKDGSPEQMAVGVAQNYSKANGLTAMNGENVFGRTYTSKGYDTRPDAKLYGANFAEQWEYALKVDPEFVFVTSFNEWVAGRFEEWGGVTNAFPDSFNDTYSRDCEPSKGDLKDNYYYQLASYIRRYKGAAAPLAISAPKSIDLSSPTDQWADVTPAYYAYEGNTFDRDDIGYAGIHYTDSTGRNDITLSKVARDSDSLYFLVECKETITSPSGGGWMRLFLKTGSGANWEGYQYVINRNSPNGKATIERSTGGWNWEKAGDAEYRLAENRLELKVPKAALGISGDSFRLEFKWSDNMQNDGDVFDFYLHGDSAPMGRFNYIYQP